MAYDVAADARLDPRLKAILSAIPTFTASDVDSRETLLAEASSDAARQEAQLFRSFMELCDTEEAAPAAGLRVRTEHVISAPDGNTINLQVIRPDTDETLACVYYIHGGGMTSLSCYDGMYRSWGRLIAANGVPLSWSTSATRSRPHRCPRSLRSLPGSMTASRGSGGSPPTRRTCGSTRRASSSPGRAAAAT